MKVFEAAKVTDSDIELTSLEALEELYTAIDAEEAFILKWREGKVDVARVFYGNNLSGKVKTGDLKLFYKGTGDEI